MSCSLNAIYSSALKFYIRTGLELCLHLRNLTAFDISRADVQFVSAEDPDQYFLWILPEKNSSPLSPIVCYKNNVEIFGLFYFDLLLFHLFFHLFHSVNSALPLGVRVAV